MQVFLSKAKPCCTGQTSPPPAPLLPPASAASPAEAAYGQLLAPYLADPSNLFVISSDFCHWGRRFGYTYYEPERVGGARGQPCRGGGGGGLAGSAA